MLATNPRAAAAYSAYQRIPHITLNHTCAWLSHSYNSFKTPSPTPVKSHPAISNNEQLDNTFAASGPAIESPSPLNPPSGRPIPGGALTFIRTSSEFCTLEGQRSGCALPHHFPGHHGDRTSTTKTLECIELSMDIWPACMSSSTSRCGFIMT